MGFNTEYWGPRLWEALHCITFDYPIVPTIEDKKNMSNFFSSLCYVLPCIYCRKNYKRNLNEYPIQLDNRKNLVMWLIDLHNEVNGKEGRRHYTYEEVIKMYEKKLGKRISLTEDDSKIDLVCKRHSSNNMKIIIVIMILLLVFYIIQNLIKWYKLK